MAQTKVSLVDLNSNELILDLDGDTTLHSSTDDQIDIKIAGADDFTFTAGAFNVLASSHAVFADSSEAKFGAGTDLQIYHDGTNSFIANKTGRLKIATETSGIAITIGHTTSEVTVADNLTVTGNANIGCSLTFSDGSIALSDIDIDGGTDIGAAIVDADLFIVDDGAGGTNRKTAASRLLTYAMAGTLSEAAQTNITSLGTLTTLTVDDITINGSTISDGSHFTVDAGGDIILDSDSGFIRFKDDGTTIGTISNSSSDLVITSGVQDKDIIFKGDDGGSAITALTLDMSAAGAATFNDKITAVGTSVFTNLDISGDVDIDGTTNLDVVDIDGAVDMASTLGVTGVVTANAGVVVDNITIDGNEIDVGSGDLTLDSAGDIILDAALNDVIFSKNGTERGRILLDEADFKIQSTATNSDIILDADGGDIFLKDDGTTYGSLTNTSGNLIIKSGTTTAATFSGANVTFAGTIDSGAITSTGVVTATGFTIGSAVIGEAELEILDGLAATTAELTIIDGNTSATSTTVADADRVVLNDNGTMVQVAVTDLAAYFDDEITAMPNLTSVGTLTTLTVDNIIINGANIGHTSDADALAIDSSGNVTASQNLIVNHHLYLNI